MKTVFSNNQVAHVWAQQNQSRGRGSSFFFEDDKIYSYGKHFCIARILPGGKVLFTTRTYGQSTSKHLSYTRQAVNHREVIHCFDPSEAPYVNMRHAMNVIESLIKESKLPRKREATRVSLRHQAYRVAQEANKYLEAVKDESGAELCAPIQIDKDDLENIEKQLEASEKLRQEVVAQRQASEKKNLLVKREQWRNHEIVVHTSLYKVPVALRITERGDEIETSHGARIPLFAAHKLWPAICSVKAKGVAYIPSDAQASMTRNIGHFTLNEIRADGSIRVGCHDIAYAEIEYIAKKLGLMKEEASA